MLKKTLKTKLIRTDNSQYVDKVTTQLLQAAISSSLGVLLFISTSFTIGANISMASEIKQGVNLTKNSKIVIVKVPDGMGIPKRLVPGTTR